MLPISASSGSAPVLVPFARWQKACDRVSAALLGGETRVVLTGPPGTGKTLLLDHIARVLRAAGWTVMMRLADESAPAPGRQGSVALLIDEADRLSRDALQHLLAATPCPLVLVGLDALQSRVTGATQIALGPLGREEARDYIAQWLTLTGRAPVDLAAEAMRRVVEISGGVPRLMSTLLGAAVWLAESSDETTITAQHVDEAAALRSCFVRGETGAEPGAEPGAQPGAQSRERTNTPLLVAVAAAMLLLGAGAYVATRYYPAETQGAIDAIRDTGAQVRTAIDEAINGPTPTPNPTRPVPTKLTSAAPATIAPASPTPVRVAAAPKPIPAPPVVATPVLAPSVPAAPVLAAPVLAVPAPPLKPPEPVSEQTDAVAPPAPPPPAPAEPARATPPPMPAVVWQTAPSSPTPSLVASQPTTGVPPETGPAAPLTAAAPVASTAEPPHVEPPSPAPAPPPAPPPAPVVVASAAPPPPPREPSRTLPPDTISLLVRRGNDMMGIGDVSAARLLFGRAAEAGNTDAMVAMGRTFDATFLAQASPLLSADPAEAAHWYRRAAELGNKDADDLLHRAESRAAR